METAGVPEGNDFEIERVRAQLSEARAEQILGFWAERGALKGDAARSRLGEVVCVLLDGSDSVIGVNSVYADEVEPLGGRRLWMYRSLLESDAAAEAERAMIDAAHGALAEEFVAGAGGPIGLCALLSDPEIIERNPETIWPGTGMLYAGYLPDGRQIRVGWFEGALI